MRHPFLQLALLALILAPSAAWSWQFVRDGNGAVAVLTDAGGDVFSAGLLIDSEGTPQMSVVKHDGRNGAERWRYIVDTGGPTYRHSASLLWAEPASVLVATHQGERYTDHMGTVARIDSESGLEIWRSAFTGAAFNAVALDSAGDVVAAGQTSGATGTDKDIIVVKLSGVTGSGLWRVVINGQLNRVDVANAVQINQDGDVFVGGGIEDDPTLNYPDFVIFKLSGGDGTVLWSQKILSTAGHGGEVSSLDLDSNGDVVAAGHAVLLAWCDFVVGKFSGSSGAEAWRHLVTTPGGGCDVAKSVTVDSGDDVIATGSLGPTLFTTVKASGVDGAQLWRRDIPNLNTCTGGGCATGRSVTTDSLANVLVAGKTSDGDITVAKLASASGAEVWLRRIDYDGCGDRAFAVAADASDDVVVSGEAFAKIDGACGWPQGSRYAVLKLTGQSGLDYWDACQDERDNDADSLVDFPADLGCSSVEDASEKSGCVDGIDNDEDGLVDYPDDPGCRNRRSLSIEDPECDDGTDNDSDGLTDDLDPECTADRWWGSEAVARNTNGGCGLGYELAFLLPILIRLFRHHGHLI